MSCDADAISSTISIILVKTYLALDELYISSQSHLRSTNTASLGNISTGLLVGKVFSMSSLSYTTIIKHS